MTAIEYLERIAMISKIAIDEDDYALEWDEFHKLHPAIDRWEYDFEQKKIQEM